MKDKYEEIVALTDAVCKAHLNQEYADLSRRLAAHLCRKRPSPVVNGQAKSWAGGIVYALGQINFLFDKSQTLHSSPDELSEYFDVGKNTLSTKAKQIRDIINSYQMDPEWSLPSMIDRNPLVWMLSVNGLIVDVRHMPREVQEIAFERGLIPYIPADKNA